MDSAFDTAQMLAHSYLFGGISEVKKLVRSNPCCATARDADGLTVLHALAAAGFRDIVQMFIASGADVNAKDSDGWTPLHYAANTDAEEHSETEDTQQSDGMIIVAELSFPKGTSYDVAELLLASGADVDIQGSEGCTPLHCAASLGNIAVARLLVTHGANVGARDSDGHSPLAYAQSEGRTKMVDWLRQHGATD